MSDPVVPPSRIVHRVCGNEEVLAKELAYALANRSLSELPCVYCSGTQRFPLGEFTEPSHERILLAADNGKHPEGRPDGVGHKKRIKTA